MHALQQCKFVQLIPPGVIKDDASHVTSVVDTLGWDYATAVLSFGATDIAMADIDIQESDDNSNFTEVAATDFTDNTQVDMDGTALALPDANADNTNVVIHLDMRKRKRYIKMTSTAGNGSTGTYASAIAILSRGETLPNSSAEQAGTGGIVVIV